MKKTKVITPENIEVEYTLAGIASRTCAATIDILITLLFSILIGVCLLLIFLNMDDFWNEYFGWIIATALILHALMFYGYYIYMDMSNNGQSLGKKLLGLRTIRKNGQPITLKHSAIRNSIRIFLDMYGIGLVTMFASNDCRRVGDYVASTIVILENENERPVELDLLNMSRQFLSHLTIEEKELLRRYYQRKNDLRNPMPIKESLLRHFEKKYERLGILDVVKEDLKRI